MQGVLTKGIELGYKADSGSTYTKIPGLKEFPDMGGAPEQIDITTFEGICRWEIIIDQRSSHIVVKRAD